MKIYVEIKNFFWKFGSLNVQFLLYIDISSIKIALNR